MCVLPTAYSSKIPIHTSTANRTLALLLTVLAGMIHHVQGVDDSSRPLIVPTPMSSECVHSSVPTPMSSECVHSSVRTVPSIRRTAP